jgi:hypothetical protein
VPTRVVALRRTIGRRGEAIRAERPKDDEPPAPAAARIQR